MKSNLIASCLAGLVLMTAAVVLKADDKVGVVANIKVVSDKVEDVSSIEAWKKSYIKDGMSDQDKALAIWKTVVKFRFQTYPPCEGTESEGNHVHDAFKMFNVYGYCQCCCASAVVECLGRYIGMETRGWSITTHSVAEVKYDGTWHMLDGAYGEYWVKPDGKLAGVEEIVAAVMDWYKANPAAKGKAAEYGPAKGPSLLAKNDFYEKNNLPLTVWAAGMHAFECEKPGVLNNAYIQGYRVNIQLREGEKLTRNWSNKGLEINPGGAECMGPLDKPVHKALGDMSPIRVGNGTHEYVVPLAGEGFKQGAMDIVNIASTADDKATPAVHVKDAASEGSFVVRMNSSYVYLGGQVALKTAVGDGGSVEVLFSTNHGLDYKSVGSYNAAGDQTIDLKKLANNCYDYRLKFVLKGKGTGIDSLKISNDIQHSTAPLPAIAKGANKVTFSAGEPEGTITYEGGMTSGSPRPFSMFKPVRDGIKVEQLTAPSGKGTAVFALETPGEMNRIRLSSCYRARDKKDSYTVDVSYDEGKTWKPAGALAGPGRTLITNLVVDKLPAGTKKAQLRLTAKVINTLTVSDLRIDCDYKLPFGGFRPVQITYLWDESGAEKKDVHVAATALDSYTINVAGEPKLKSIVLELAPAK
jgi:hypothetical protein